MSAVGTLTFEELYRQIEDLAEGITGEIIEPDVLSTMSRPGLPHEDVLEGCYEGLAGWRVDRVAKLPKENPLTILPDWCCDVLSPSTAKKDRTKKLPIYAAAGVPWVWIIEPATRTIEVFQTNDARPSLFATADETESPPLPPFEALSSRRPGGRTRRSE